MIRIFFSIILVSILACGTKKNVVENTTAPTSTEEAPKKKVKEVVDDYFERDYKKLKTEILDPKIKTVLTRRVGWELSESAAQLNRDTLIFSFDDLQATLGNYYYTVIHCNADWTPSDLLETEYIEGFFQDYITTFNYSFNTLTNYIHYEVPIPNRNMRLTKSGNYIFKVYRDNDPSQVVFTKQFMLFENIIQTEATVVRPSIVDDRDEKQEVDFKLNLGSYLVNDTYNDLKVVLLQNQRLDNAITNLKPLYIRGSELDYNYNKENVFDGLNEYRFLNIKSVRYRGQKIEQIRVENKQTSIQLFTEQDRRFKNYLNYQDLNGNYLVNIQEGVDSRIEADYVDVTFSIASRNELITGDVYVFGGISNNQFDDQFKLTYNTEKQAYEGTVKLKQGYYDYYYAFKSKNGEVDIPQFEGNHFETGNNYTIITYVRERMADYDRIVGYYSFVSNR